MMLIIVGVINSMTESKAVLCVLAGGSSRRFTLKNGIVDKALIEINGVPVLKRLMSRAINYFDKIAVSVNRPQQIEKYQRILDGYKVDFITDLENVKLQGVMLGKASTMAFYPDHNIQFLPVDQPLLPLSLLKSMKTKADGVSLLLFSTGMVNSLTALYGKLLRLPKVFYSFELSRSDTLIRLAPRIWLYEIQAILEKNQLDKEIFVNINTLEDLQRYSSSETVETVTFMPQPIEIKRGDAQLNKIDKYDEDLSLALIEKQQYYAAFLVALLQKEQKIINTTTFSEIGIKSLIAESLYWEEKGLLFLAYHSLLDLAQYFPAEVNQAIEYKILNLRKQLTIKSKKVE